MMVSQRRRPTRSMSAVFCDELVGKEANQDPSVKRRFIKRLGMWRTEKHNPIRGRE